MFFEFVSCFDIRISNFNLDNLGDFVSSWQFLYLWFYGHILGTEILIHIGKVARLC